MRTENMFDTLQLGNALNLFNSSAKAEVSFQCRLF